MHVIVVGAAIINQHKMVDTLPQIVFNPLSNVHAFIFKNGENTKVIMH